MCAPVRPGSGPVRRGDDDVRWDHAHWNDVFCFGNGLVGGHRHQRVEVSRCQCVFQIAEVVRPLGPDQGEVGSQGKLEQILAPIEIDGLLALRDQRANACGRQDAAQAHAACANAFRESALGHQLDLQPTFEHQLLGLRVGADMACNESLDNAG